MSSEAPTQTFERVTDDSVSGILSDVQASFGAANQAGAQSAVEPAPAPEQQPTPTEPQPSPTQPEEKPTTEPEPAAAEKVEGAEAAQTDLSIPTPESRLAPLFDLVSLPLEEALPKAVSEVRSLYQHDPIAYTLFANAIIHASP
jgi:hypothetical protein